MEGMQLECQTNAKNYTLLLPTALSLTPLNGLLSLSRLTGSLRPPLSECVFPCALIKHNMLVRFITDTYFKTFLTLQVQEDQASSIINFLQEPDPSVCVPQSKPCSLALSLSLSLRNVLILN